MLEIKDLDAYYGRIRALKKVALQVGQGEIVALIGSNGAGKTTLLSVISGLVKPGRGEIQFQGRSLRRVSPPEIVRRGIVQVPEGRQLFGPLTVMDNLEIGAYTRYRKDGRQKIREEIDRVLEMFPILGERRDQLAGTLSGGEQQMLAIGRGMMGGPSLLLLDEPSLGLAPMVVREILQTIQTLKDQGVTILLVEQNARAALAVSDRAYVLETGRTTISGPSAELLQDDRVRQAFLGKRPDPDCEVSE